MSAIPIRWRKQHYLLFYFSSATSIILRMRKGELLDDLSPVNNSWQGIVETFKVFCIHHKPLSLQATEPRLLLVSSEEALDRIRRFVSDDPSNKHLLMSLLSSVSRQKTVMMTTTPLSVQDVVDALDNANKSQPKVSELSTDPIGSAV